MVLRAHAVHPGHHRDIQPAIIAYLAMKSIEQCKRCCENGDDALLREEVIVIPSPEFVLRLRSFFIVMSPITPITLIRYVVTLSRASTTVAFRLFPTSSSKHDEAHSFVSICQTLPPPILTLSPTIIGHL